MVIHVRYHESQVCDVMTEPSVDAFLPTMMLVHARRSMPWGVVSSTWALAVKAAINVRAANSLVFIIA